MQEQVDSFLLEHDQGEGYLVVYNGPATSFAVPPTHPRAQSRAQRARAHAPTWARIRGHTCVFGRRSERDRPLPPLRQVAARPATHHRFRLKALNAVGASPYSPVLALTTPPAPPPPPPPPVVVGTPPPLPSVEASPVAACVTTGQNV